MRIYYMDSLRSVLIIMGIFLHAANVYHVDGSWMITDPEQHIVFNYLTHFIHLFRMPAFFILSGYFSLFIYQRYGVKKYFRYRLRQIIIPVLVIGLVVNSLQGALLYYGESSIFNGRSFVDGYLFSGAWISHLWFLVFLLIFIILLGLIMPILDRSTISTTGRAADYFREHKAWVIFLFPVYFVVVKAAATVMPGLFQRNFYGFWAVDLFFYAYYFAFGVLLRRHEGMLDSMVGRYNRLAIVVALLCWGGLSLIGTSSLPGRIVEIYAQNLLSVILIFLVWHFFQRFFNKPSRWIEGLSKSCYSIYLFHHILIIAFGLLFVPLAVSPVIKFALVTVLTLVITTSFHFGVVEKFAAARLLFNGKKTNEG